MKKPSKYLLERRKLRNKKRKILNLEERVQAIHLYDRDPVYMRVAQELQCSWEQIKSVVQNRDAILQYYARCQQVSANDNRRMARQMKINFLGKVMYEYVRRVHYHQHGVLSNDSLRVRALMFRKALRIPDFYPNKLWVNSFMHAHNLDLQRLDLVITEEPPKSLMCADIIAYCKEKELSEKSSEAVKGENVNEAENALGRTTDTKILDDVDLEGEDEYHYDDDDDDESDFKDEGHDVTPVENKRFIDFPDDADEEINENEEGPTIYYGDFGDMDDDEEDEEEEGEEDRRDVDNLGDLTEREIEKLPAQRDTNEQPETSFSERISPQTSLKPPPELPAEALPPSEPQPETPAERARNIDSSQELAFAGTEAADVLLPTCQHSRIDDYAAALSVLQPLEEFALLQEDFRALNLVAQLVAVCQSGLKRTQRIRT